MNTAINMFVLTVLMQPSSLPSEMQKRNYRKELEESKQRKELARKVINDQRKEIERLKARAEEAFCFKECGVTCCDTDGCENLKAFLQKLDEQ